MYYEKRYGMSGKVMLPMGIENFMEMRTGGFYYVDKTGLIKTLLENPGKVNLFTRPRRFGKTLNMSMLKAFFEYGCSPQVFEGLEITEETELCEKYMGRFPVISVSLKSVEEKDFVSARSQMCTIIGNEALRFKFLLRDSAYGGKPFVERYVVEVVKTAEYADL